jgi:ferredoxin
MKESADPWMCYYCGDCSDTCPREAEPAEMMMASRRWLTAAYDWTGIGKIMYEHEFMEIVFLLIGMLGMSIWFWATPNFGFQLLAQHPEAMQHVNLLNFAPTMTIHIFDLGLAAVLSFLILSNAFRMVTWVMKGTRVPFSAYITEFKVAVVHLFTQKQWSKCETKATIPWMRHIFLVTGYATMFILVVFFLPWFQIPDTRYHWSSLLGYYATVGLFGVSIWMLKDRIEKKDQVHKFSYLSDWMFPILLSLVALTGILVHFFRLFDLAMPLYYMYWIHISIAVSMVIVEVPYGKWSHLAYRPLAAYLAAVRKHAVTAEVVKPAFATQ